MALSPSPLLLAADELERRADYGDFRDRQRLHQVRWSRLRGLAVQLREEAAAPVEQSDQSGAAR
jgi:hypothetical protein